MRPSSIGLRVTHSATPSPSASPPAARAPPPRKNKRMLGLRPSPPLSKRAHRTATPPPARRREADVESLGSTACSPASSVRAAAPAAAAAAAQATQATETAEGGEGRGESGPASPPRQSAGEEEEAERERERKRRREEPESPRAARKVARKGEEGKQGKLRAQVAAAPQAVRTVQPAQRESAGGADAGRGGAGERLDPETAAMLKLAAVANAEDIVWTKIKGHPYWPSQVVNVTRKLAQEERFKAAEPFKKRGDETCVQYFGTLEIAWVDRAKSCIGWTEGVAKALHTAMPKRLAYSEALGEVKGYCARQTRYPRGWWCEPSCFLLEAEFIDRFAPDDDEQEDGSGRLVDDDDEDGENDDEDDDHAMLANAACDEPEAKKLFATARAERVVWAKVRGFPEWPVQIIPHAQACHLFPELKLHPPPASVGAKGSGAKSSAKPTSKVSKSSSGHVPCMFFGTGEVANIPEKSFTEFEEGVRKDFYVSSDARDFRIALGEAYGFLKTPRVWPSGFASHRVWWNAPDETTTDEEDVTAKAPASVPRYEFLRRSSWPDGESPPPRSKRAEIPVCMCSPNASGACTDSSCLNFMSQIICAPGLCPAGETCKNVSFHRRPKKGRPLRPFYTADGRGWGLRTAKRITKGEFVVEYVGEIIDKNECERRLKAVQKSAGGMDYYMMEISSDHVLDARVKGNLSRFINSSCAPNCATQKWTEASTGQTRVGIFALEDITAGSELLYNYCFEDFGLASKKGVRSFTCRCGSPSCCMYAEGERERTSDVVGRRLKVRWDDGWYSGVVQKYDPVDKAFDILYDDGDTERLGLGENPAYGGDTAFKLLPKVDVP